MILIKKPADTRPSEITPLPVYEKRREFIKTGVGLLISAGVSPAVLAKAEAGYGGRKLDYSRTEKYSTKEEMTEYKDITEYNNFYEFGTDKYSPAKRARTLRTSPWSVTVSGHCEKPGTFQLEDILKQHALQERIYRLRCVEGWSMVIPWVGFPLADMLKRFRPTSQAKYVEFVTLKDPKQMPGQKSGVLDWPYVEGLRIDEAMNPLSLMAVGLYGEVLPNQNGAPLRLVVPWKYGFKSIKSIVEIRFVDKRPVSSWMRAARNEYGFYSNVNPLVDHPRWSQKRERRIGDFFKIKTKMFNGYADEVAHLYSGMDLRKNF